MTIDDGVGIRTAVEHLVKLGHRRIAHVAGPPAMLHGHRRAEAFRAAVQDAGLDGALVVETDFSAKRRRRGDSRAPRPRGRPTDGHRLLERPHGARGPRRRARAGISVPEQLSITGFDNTDLADHVFPSLTSVATDAASWGAVAARTLLASIAGDAPADVELDPPRLVTRESTGRAPN